MPRATSIQSAMASERDRLQKAIASANEKRDAIDAEIKSLTAELKAVNAYHAAKGKAGSAEKPAKRATKKPAKTARKGRRSGIREQVLDAVQNAAEGISRGDLLQKMGMKGNKSAEMAVTNALAALKKASKLVNVGGLYKTS